MSIWLQSGAAKGAFGYTSLELSGGVVAGDTHLRIINILMLFSRGTGRIHLEKEYRQKRDLKDVAPGFPVFRGQEEEGDRENKPWKE